MDENIDAPGRTGWRRVLVGDDGLRAGWSLLLFALLAGAIGWGLTAASHHIIKGPPPAKNMPGIWWRTVMGDLSAFTVFGLASLVVALVERRPFARYGLRAERWWSDLLAGMAWGAVMLSLLVGTLAAIGALRFDGVLLGGSASLRYGAEWLLAFMAVGLAEEYVTRGFLQYTAARGLAAIVQAAAPRTRHARTIGFWAAAAIFSVGIFALGHLGNAGETAMGLVAVGLAGVTFVYVLYRTGSLWWAIGFHGTWDWAQSYFYGVRDSGLAVEGHLLATHPAGDALLSGGATGPEGSILVVPTLLLTMLVIRATLPRRATAFDAAERSATDRDHARAGSVLLGRGSSMSVR